MKPKYKKTETEIKQNWKQKWNKKEKFAFIWPCLLPYWPYWPYWPYDLMV